MNIDAENANVRAALVNSGKYSIPEADAKLAAAMISIVIGPAVVSTVAGQAAFLTAVATASRCFGRVGIAGELDVPLVVPLPIVSLTLGEAAKRLGATETGELETGRRIAIGDDVPVTPLWDVQAFWDGWVVGVTARYRRQCIGRSNFALSGIAAGSLAVGQAFLAEQGDQRAGRMTQCLSLWLPDVAPADATNPSLDDISLPRALWLVGIGNLGQAYLWSLFALPYADPSSVMLFLQDDDLVTSTNWGTSLLVERGRYDVLKTKVAEEWADRRKFQVRRIDRRLDKTCRRRDSEPGLALSGLDRMPPRRLLGLPGFDHVIDCGLGATYSSYQDIRMNVFDRQHDPAQHFDGVEDQTEQIAKSLRELHAYKELTRALDDGGCGAALLSEKGVAVPFVSAFAGALAVTQAIRIASNEAPYRGLRVTSGDLKTLKLVAGDRPRRPTIETTASSPAS
ncbi:MAG: hypothetical protein WAW96_03365 [Alphaproteobacteria bacterium]